MTRISWSVLAGPAALILLTMWCVFHVSESVTASACTPPANDYGSVAFNNENGANKQITINQAGVYTIWTRMVAPAGATNKTYMLEIDGDQCYVVGGQSVPTYAANASMHFSTDANDTSHWIRHTTAGSDVTRNLSAGQHTLRLIGNEPGVMIDSIVFVYQNSCIPRGKGSNCTNQDTVSPVSQITSPTHGTTVASGFTVDFTTSDNVNGSGVARVELMINGTLHAGIDNPPPLAFTNVHTTPGVHSLKIRTYDHAGNSADSAVVNITVRGPTDTSEPIVSDFTKDGCVRLDDFTRYFKPYYLASPRDLRGDLDGNGRLDLADFTSVFKPDYIASRTQQSCQ